MSLFCVHTIQMQTCLRVDGFFMRNTRTRNDLMNTLGALAHAALCALQRRIAYSRPQTKTCARHDACKAFTSCDANCCYVFRYSQRRARCARLMQPRRPEPCPAPRRIALLATVAAIAAACVESIRAHQTRRHSRGWMGAAAWTPAVEGVCGREKSCPHEALRCYVCRYSQRR